MRQTKQENRNSCARKAAQKNGFSSDMVRQTIPEKCGRSLRGVMKRHLSCQFSPYPLFEEKSKTHDYPRIIPNQPRITSDIRESSDELNTVFQLSDIQGLAQWRTAPG